MNRNFQKTPDIIWLTLELELIMGAEALRSGVCEISYFRLTLSVLRTILHYRFTLYVFRNLDRFKKRKIGADGE